VAESLASVPDVVVGTFNIGENHYPKEWFAGVDVYDVTLVLLPPNGDPDDTRPLLYRGKLRRQPILDFLKKRVPSVGERWETIKAAADKLRVAEQAATKQAKENEAQAEEPTPSTGANIDDAPPNVDGFAPNTKLNREYSYSSSARGSPMDQKALDNRSNQRNPNHPEFGGKHANLHNPTSKDYDVTSPCCSTDKMDQAARDNRSNQLNPNNDEFHRRQEKM